jgi:hypothetical protein
MKTRHQWGLPEWQAAELRREEMQRWWRYERALQGGAPPGGRSEPARLAGGGGLLDADLRYVTDSDTNVTALYIPVNATSDTGSGDVPAL